LSKFIPVEPGILKKWNETEKRFIYYLDYYDEQAERKRPSTGTGSLTFARELLLHKKDEVNKRKHFPDRYILQVKFSDFVDNEYLPVHVKGLKSALTTTGICKKLKARHGDKFLHEITEMMVEAHKADLIGKVADNTINNELNTLSGIFTFARKKYRDLKNPVQGVKRFRITERKRTLERSEQKALIIAAGQEEKAPHLQALIIFDLHTALRKEELLSVKWSDVDFINKQILVREEIAKYHKSRYIDLDKFAIAVLESLPRRGEYVFCDSSGKRFKNFRRSFQSAVKRAGLKDVVIHDLRKTCGANWIMAGISLATVQVWMGHESINTTINHYGHLVKSFRKEEIEKIEGWTDISMDTCMDTWLKSYTEEACKSLKNMVPPAGIEPAAPGLGNLCSIRLS
jgi:integrase